MKRCGSASVTPSSNHYLKRGSGFGGDMEAVEEWLDRLAPGPGDERRLWYRLLMTETEGRLLQYWRAVERLARALLDRQTLTGKELRAEWFKALAPSPEQQEAIRRIVAAQSRRDQRQ